jgi:hypothetical protein
MDLPSAGVALGALVSVIVPVRNRRDLLRQTLDALALQTLRDFEVIVVDDGSTDGSAAEAEADAAAGRPVRVVSTTGVGAVAARRLGVEASSAPYLAFTDSDCVPATDWLENGVAALQDGGDVVQGVTRPTRAPRPHERTVWSVADDGLFATCNVFYRRDAYDRVGGFDGSAGGRLGFRPGTRLRMLGFGEDTLLGWAVRRKGEAAWRPDVQVQHQVFPADPRDAIQRAWTIGAFPALIREVPELRRLFGPQLRAGAKSRAPLYAAVSATVLGRRRAGAAIAAAWMAQRAAIVWRTEPVWRRRAKALPLDIAVEATKAAALVAGSIRSGTIIL